MAFTKTDIVNKALHHLGCEKITSLTDQNKRAKLMSDIYDITRESCLEDHFWGFAKKRVTLTPLVQAPEFEWAYQFNIPSDCLKIWKELNNEPYTIEGKKVLSNTNSLQIIYISNISDSSIFSLSFVECLSLKLARDACYSLIQSNERHAFLEKLYREQLVFAMSNIDRQENPTDPEIDDFIAVRY